MDVGPGIKVGEDCGPEQARMIKASRAMAAIRLSKWNPLAARIG